MRNSNPGPSASSAVPLVLILVLWSVPVWAENMPAGKVNLLPQRSSGQTVYVPVYSHIFFGDREIPFLLAVTVLVRNTDPQHSIQVRSADYHDSNGRLIRRFLTQPALLRPLATAHFLIPESDEAGGAGANVVVTWRAGVPVNPPILESVMIGTRSQQGVSFTSRGQVLDLPPTIPTYGSQPASIDEIRPRQP